MFLTEKKIAIIIRALKDPSLIIRSKSVPIMIGTNIQILPYLLINIFKKQYAIFVCYEKSDSPFYYIIEDSCHIIKKCTSFKTYPFIFGTNASAYDLRTSKNKKIPFLNHVNNSYQYYKNE